MATLDSDDRNTIAFPIYITGAIVAAGLPIAPWLLGTFAAYVGIKYLIRQRKAKKGGT